MFRRICREFGGAVVQAEAAQVVSNQDPNRDFAIVLIAADGPINALSCLTGIRCAFIAVIAYYRFGGASSSWIAGIFGAGNAVIAYYRLSGASSSWIAGIFGAGIAIIAYHRLSGAPCSWIAGIFGAGIAIIAYYRLGGAPCSWIAGIFGAGIAVIAICIVATGNGWTHDGIDLFLNFRLKEIGLHI